MNIETLVAKIAEEIAEHGIEDITGSTVVYVSKTDPTDVQVFEATFNTYTNGYTAQAGHLCQVEDDEWEIDMAAKRVLGVNAFGRMKSV